MALFSVYDYDKRTFDYYETPGAHQAIGSVEFGTFRGAKNLKGNNGVGAVPESIAVPLPSGAKKVGQGDIPKGVIATKNKPLLGSFGKWPVYLLIGATVYHVMRKK